LIEFRPTELPTVRPRILLVGHWVKFSSGFPDNLDFVKGQAFSITAQQQVSYALSYSLKEGCYYDINLSNEDAGEKLYPDNRMHLYEMLIGLRDGNYFLMPYFPADYPIYRLDYATMSPLVSETPPDNPTLRLYLLYDQTPVILRVCVDDGVAYEKCTLEILINRCLMKAGTPPVNITPKFIEYLDEIKTLTPVGG
jgi:hypothetical protein